MAMVGLADSFHNIIWRIEVISSFFWNRVLSTLCRSISCLRQLHIRTRTGLNSRSGQLVWRPLRGERFTQVLAVVSHARNAYAAESAWLLQERNDETGRYTPIQTCSVLVTCLSCTHVYVYLRTYLDTLYTAMSVHYNTTCGLMLRERPAGGKAT